MSDEANTGTAGGPNDPIGDDPGGGGTKTGLAAPGGVVPKKKATTGSDHGPSAGESKQALAADG